MEENAFLKYNAFDGLKRAPNVDEIVRIVLDEQKHSLTEEDRKILRDRENLRNEFHTLQNVDLSAAKLSPSQCEDVDGSSPLWIDLTAAEPSTSFKSDVYFVDVEAIEQPSLACDNVESSNTELDNTIANFIQDDNVKAEVLRLNQQIRLHSTSIRSLREEAQNVMADKLKFQRKLASYERKIVTFSSEEVRIRRIKRRRGTDSADTGHQKRTYFYRFGAPYFKTKDRYPADRNPDLLEIVRTNQPMNIHLPRARRILSHDAAFLEKSILKQLKAKRLEQLQKCLLDVDNRFRNDRSNGVLAEEMMCIARTIKETQQITRISATKDWNIPVDFMALTPSPRFSSDDYERIWRLSGSPTLTRGEFSEQEVAELMSLANKHKEQDWDQIASEMSTNRSGFMCFTKYVTTRKKGKNKPWTKEENELLHNLCISMDSVSKSDSRFQFWKNIRCHFPHRSYTQIHSHWTYVLEPRLKKGRFTPEESKLMQKMFNDGKSYKEIAETMQNRSVVQVRTHLEVLQQTEISRGNWTAEEEEKLLQLIEKYGPHDWVTISKELGTRNRSQCRLKYSVYLRNNQRFSAGTRAPKEFWTEEENQQFKDLLFKYGSNFKLMSQEIGTKTRDQVRHKYHRTKHKSDFQDVPDNSKSLKVLWTDEEVEQFKELLMAHGAQYKLIASFMPSKTTLQLRYKYHSMKNKWNLSLPEVDKSVNCVEREETLEHSVCNNSVSAPSASLPVTLIVEPPKTLVLPEELFENSAPVVPATPPPSDNSLVVSSSDPLFVPSEETKKLAAPGPESHFLSSEETEKLAAPGPKYHFVSSEETEKLSTPRPKSRKRKSSKGAAKFWSPVELEHYKRLLMVHGRDFKKISSIMLNKSVRQLRWKYYDMRDKWDTSMFPSSSCTGNSKRCRTAATPRKVCKKSCETKQEPPPQLKDEKTYDNLRAVIFEVSRAPSSPDISSVAVGDISSVAVPMGDISSFAVGDISSVAVPIGDISSVAVGDISSVAVPMGDISSVAVPLGDLGDESTSRASQERLASKSSSLKTLWSDDDLEWFKRLLVEHGPQHKRISQIMKDKTVSQLRYKYQWLKKAGQIPSAELTGDGTKPRAPKRIRISNHRSVPGPLQSDLSSRRPLPMELFENIVSSVVATSSQPVYVASEEHSLLFSNASNLSMFVDSTDEGFAGFPEESREPLSFQNLISLHKIETIRHMEHPGSSHEQMIVPERIVEMSQRTGESDGSNECSSAANNLNGNAGDESSQTDLASESVGDAVLEVKREIDGDEIKEEDRRDEFSN